MLNQLAHEKDARPVKIAVAMLTMTVMVAVLFTFAVSVKASENELLIPVSQFKFSGHTVFAKETLASLVVDLIGRELKFAQLEEAAERITRFYRDHGFVVATAYIPAQEIGDDQVVEIVVLEGRYGQVMLRNASRLSDQVAKSLLDPVAPGVLIEAEPLERALRLLNETPGVKARSALSAGSEPGTTDLTVELEDAKRFSGVATVDNYGNEHTGRIRATVSLDVNNVHGTGDQFDLQVITTGKGLFHGQVGYSALLGSSAMRWNASYTSSRYEMGGPFAGLDVKGTTNNLKLGVTYPYKRIAPQVLEGHVKFHRVDLGFAFENRSMNNSVSGLDGARSVQAVLLSWDGHGQTHDTQVQLRSTVTAGRLTIPDAPEKLLDTLGPKTAGDYIKLQLDLSAQQSLGGGRTQHVAISGQWASKNLHNSEKMALGGAQGIRAYGPGEMSGDVGVLMRLEWQGDLSLPALRWAGFADGGVVQVDKNPWSGGTNNHLLLGVGVGLIYAIPGSFDVRVDYAMPVFDRAHTEGRVNIKAGLHW